MTLLGGLSGATLLSYIYTTQPSLSKFHSSPLRYTVHTNTLSYSLHKKDLRVLNKQLNYRPRYSNSEIEKREAIKQCKAHLTHEQTRT
jgi:hypothetical protein